MPDESVRYETHNGVATVQLNRPDAMNALDLATKRSLLDAVHRAADDAGVRAVVLIGSGRAFCAGQDLHEHRALLEAGDPAPLSTVAEHYNPIAIALTTMPKPVIAAVNGVAAGAGLGLVLACDLRLAADTARFTTAFAGIGLTADTGLSWTLPRAVGYTRAIEWLLLAEPVDAQRALADGLVHRLVPAQELTATAAGLAGQLAAGPTLAYAAIKRSVAFGSDNGLVATLALEAALQQACGETADHAEAVNAFVMKRPPVFAGR